MSRKNARDEPKITAVKRAFDIAETLVKEDGATVTEISEKLDLPVSTTFDHLSTLEDLDYITKSDEGYRISTKFLMMGTKMRENQEIYQHSRAELNQLAKEIGNYATLMVEEDGYGVHLHLTEVIADMPSIASPGSRTHLYMTSAGKMLLSHMNDGEIERIIERRSLPAATENTITDKNELFEEITAIREQSYAIDREESIKGLNGVAVPVYNRYENEVLGAIAVYGPSKQNVQDFVDPVLNPLREAANKIEIKYAYG